MVPEDGKDAATVPARGLAVSPSPDVRTPETLATTGASGDMTLASADTAAAPLAPEGLAAGTKLGRFLVLARVGSGGMGEVYSAFDPELDRRVAIKLLRADVAGSGEVAEARLRREARTMARLVDRNLVTVHDVGVHEGRVFVAMEFVDGATLRGWVEGQPWRAILGAYLEAGRGLAAAHAAGIVHRDFKPDNVLVARDGRVAVTDFGIARTPGSVDPDEPAVIEDIRLTTTGAIIGTPRYMAPEQFDGAIADARSDQFSFCVSLWEALYRAHPFAPAGAGFPALREAVRKGEVRPAPKSDVPPRVKAALVRGLAVDPAARWGSINEMLDALDVLAPSRRWVWIVLAGAGVIAAGSIAYGLWQREHRVVDAAETCRGSEALLAGAWDDARRAEIEHAFHATGLPYAETAYRTVRKNMNDWAQRWIDARTHACRATRVYREQSEATLDAEMRCFDAERAGARALVDVLAHATPDEVDNATWALGKLPRPERCGDPTAIAMPPPSDPVRARMVDELTEREATARALIEAGDYPSALLVLGPATVAARIVDYAPIQARLEFDFGQAEVDLGNPDQGRAHLERAEQLADVAKDDVTRGDAALALTNGAFYDSRYADARRWLSLADGAIARAGNDPTALAVSMQLRGVIDTWDGDPEQAITELKQAVAMYEQRAPDNSGLVEALGALAQAQDTANHRADARASYQRVLELGEKMFGANHPYLAKLLGNYGALLVRSGEPDAALPLFQRALAIKELVLGPDDPSLGFPIQNIAVIERSKGRWADAEAHYTRALALLEKSPTSSYAVPSALFGLAMVHMHKGDPAGAIPLLERALAMRAAAKEKPGVDAGEAELVLARATWLSGGDHAAALAHGKAARDDFAADGARDRVGEADAWLADPGHYVPKDNASF